MLCAAAFAGAGASAAPELRYSPNPNFTEKLAPKEDPALVAILESLPPRAQVAIGKLTIRGDAGSSRDELVRLARNKAAEMGADFVRITVDEDVTRRTRAPAGGVGFGGIQLRASPQTLSTVHVLRAELGAFARATLGIEYVDFGATSGRAVVKGFRATSYAPMAGVQVGDEIIEVDGIRVYGDEERYTRWMIWSVPEHVALVRLKRGDSMLVVEIALVAND
jgi:S1-C subfamily serine protease